MCQEGYIYVVEKVGQKPVDARDLAQAWAYFGDLTDRILTHKDGVFRIENDLPAYSLIGTITKSPVV